MSTHSFFSRQVAGYAAVHRDPRNKATHFVGIPIIIFSLLLILALWRVPAAGGFASGALAVGLVAIAGWIALALIDNIFQGFIEPKFLVAEAMVALGWRRDLHKTMGHVEVT